ncbi:MAG: VTT domain-containing protein [Chloroflexi bacterium]|nr:VTT domain-containing protein [Chloroflexota bacterium]
MELAPALGLIGLLLVKEVGVPIPVPGDLLVIGAGVAAAGSGAAAIVLLAAILLAGYVGGTIQYLLVRGAFRRTLLAVLRRAGVSEARIERLADWLRRRGARGVATARATPAVRVGAIAASGLAAVPLPAFVTGLVVGNGVFVGAHFALGLVVGPPALAAVSASSGPILGVVAFVVLAAVGFAGWRWLQARRSTALPAAGPAGAAAAEGAGGPARDERVALPSLGAGAWADAACPACLVISLVGGERP